MKLYWILSAAVLLIVLYVPCEGFLSAGPLQDFIDKYVDVEKFKEQGLRSLNSTAIEHIWNYFKTKFQRHYTTTDEEKARIRLFRENLKRVLESNIEEKHPFKLALNEFADMTKQEFLELKTGLRVRSNDQKSVRRGLSERSQDHYRVRSKRSLDRKRNTQRERNLNRRFFSDWFWEFFNDDEDENNNDNNEDENNNDNDEDENNNDNNEDENNNDNDEDENNNDNDENQSTDSFDWREKGVVTSIKNQGSCGSCYAFASAAVMESLYAIKTSSENPVNLSPQQIVDCSSGGNAGCNGGLFDWTVNYLQQNGGKLATEQSYPYTGTQEQCKSNNIEEVDLGNIEYTDIKQGDEKGLAEALVKYGPMFIGLHVSVDEFMYYKSGIIKVGGCPNGREHMEHALTLVGYGVDSATQQAYWIIKNSWGSEWGDNGYVRLAKDSGNMCGVTSLASYATLT